MTINSVNVNLGNVGNVYEGVPAWDDLAGELANSGVEQSPCGFAFDYTESGVDSKDIPFRTYLLMKVWGLVKIKLVHRLERDGEPEVFFENDSTIQCRWGEKQQVFVYDSKFSPLRIVVFVAGLVALFFQGPFLFAQGMGLCKSLGAIGVNFLTVYAPSLAPTVISVLSFPWVALLLAVISLQVVLCVGASVFCLVFPPVQKGGMFIFKRAFESTMQKLTVRDCTSFNQEYLQAREKNVLCAANNFMHALKVLNVVEEAVVWGAIEKTWLSLLRSADGPVDLRSVMGVLVRDKKNQLRAVIGQGRNKKHNKKTEEGLEGKRKEAEARVAWWKDLSSAMENLGWFTNVRASGISVRGKGTKLVAAAEVQVILEKLKQELALFKNEQTQKNLCIWAKRELNVVRDLRMLFTAQQVGLAAKTS